MQEEPDFVALEEWSKMQIQSVYLKIVPHCPGLNITKFLGSCVDIA